MFERTYAQKSFCSNVNKRKFHLRVSERFQLISTEADVNFGIDGDVHTPTAAALWPFELIS